MDITGRIIQLLPASSGSSARGEWSRQDFIIETQEQFPKKVCLSNWNKKVDLGQFPVGTMVTADINLESREYNGRWYTDIRVWRMQIAGQTNNTVNEPLPVPDITFSPADEDDGLPF
jgi:hypothetical protein